MYIFYLKSAMALVSAFIMSMACAGNNVLISYERAENVRKTTELRLDKDDSFVKITNNSDTPISSELDMYNLDGIIEPIDPCVVVPSKSTAVIGIKRIRDMPINPNGKIVIRTNKIHGNMDPAKPRQLEYRQDEIFLVEE